MTALQPIAIVLAIFLGAAIVIALRHYIFAKDLQRTCKGLQHRIDAYKEANNDPSASYHVKMVETDMPEYEHLNGFWGVMRLASSKGFLEMTTIKVFTDEDNDFNKREAEELCEMLNSK